MRCASEWNRPLGSFVLPDAAPSPCSLPGGRDRVRVIVRAGPER